VPESVKCPICRKQASWENNPHRPFCSERCRLLDLGSWVQERYRVPAEEVDYNLEDDGDEDDDDVERWR